MKKTLLILSIPAAVLLSLSFFTSPQQAEAQSGIECKAEPKKPHYDALWSWLKKTDYTKWNGADGKPPVFEEGGSPHGALVKIYVNATAAKNFKKLGHKSVIIKENYNKDKKLMAITVMQRTTGYDPKRGDWYYAKYMPDGTIAKTPPEKKSMPIAGKFASCIKCHNDADGGDYLFFND